MRNYKRQHFSNPLYFDKNIIHFLDILIIIFSSLKVQRKRETLLRGRYTYISRRASCVDVTFARNFVAKIDVALYIPSRSLAASKTYAYAQKVYFCAKYTQERGLIRRACICISKGREGKLFRTSDDYGYAVYACVYICNLRRLMFRMLRRNSKVNIHKTCTHPRRVRGVYPTDTPFTDLHSSLLGESVPSRILLNRRKAIFCFVEDRVC